MCNNSYKISIHIGLYFLCWFVYLRYDWHAEVLLIGHCFLDLIYILTWLNIHSSFGILCFVSFCFVFQNLRVFIYSKEVYLTVVVLPDALPTGLIILWFCKEFCNSEFVFLVWFYLALFSTLKKLSCFSSANQGLICGPSLSFSPLLLWYVTAHMKK